MLLAGIESIGSLGCSVENGRDQAIRFVVAGLSPLPGNFAGPGARLFRPGQALPSLGFHQPEREPAGPAQGTVLAVEESRDVAEVTSAPLEQLGYRVVRAENAAEALRHLQQGIGVDLLLSDIVMPGGIEAQICRERFPQLPVLLTSGFSEAAQAADGRFDILRKPFELSALERAINIVLKR